MRSVHSIAGLLPSARDTGLTDSQVADSRAKFGANRLTPLPRQPVWKKFLEKFDDPIIKILLAASLLKIVVDLFAVPHDGPLVGGLALASVLAVFLAAAFVKIGDWVPSILFGLAAGWVTVSIVIGHPSYEGLAVMVAVVLATGVAFLSEFRVTPMFRVAPEVPAGFEEDTAGVE
jgi:Ca2+-transporting ATPase